MTDQRFYRLAAQVIDYSVSLKRGEKLLIDVWDGADDLGEALMRAAYAVGGLPFLTHCSTRMERVVIENASEAYMEDWLRYQSYRMRDMDAYIVVRKKENAHELEGIDPERRKAALWHPHSGDKVVRTALSQSRDGAAGGDEHRGL